MTVINEIAAERKRQIEVEGFALDDDDDYDQGEMARVAACYALFNSGAIDEYRIAGLWPQFWDWEWWKPTTPRRDLIKAAALIVAEIERLDRASAAGHRSDCAIHNAPAMEAGPCDCGKAADAALKAPKP